MSWIDRARTLRAENKTLAEIAEIVGKSQSRVHQVLGGTVHIRAPWQEQARRMRANGASFQQICEASGKAKSTVVEAVRGVHCPINHRSKRAEKRTFRTRIVNELSEFQKADLAASVKRKAKQQDDAARRKAAEARREIRDRASRQREERALGRIDAFRQKMVKLALSEIARRHDIGYEELIGPSRVAKIMAARAEAYRSLRTHARMSTPQIAKFFGHADHTAVLHELRKHGLNHSIDDSTVA